MGDKVNVVKPDGEVVTVDREVAEALTGQRLAPHVETPEEATERARTSYNRDNTSAIQAGVLSAANTSLFGLPGMVGLPESSLEAIRTHPTGAMVGNLAAVLAPTGLMGDAAKGVSEATFLGQATKLGAEGGMVGRALEGAVTGAGLHLAGASLSDDPLSGEALAESMGIGSLLSVGLGAASDLTTRLLSAKAAAGGTGLGDLLPGAQTVLKRGPAPLAAAARARAALDEAEAVVQSTRETAALNAVVRQAKADVTATKATLDDMPEYAAFRDGYEVAQKAVKATNRELTSAQEEFGAWTRPEGVKKSLGEYEGVQGKLRSLMSKARSAGGVNAEEDIADIATVSRNVDELKRFSKNLVGSEDERAARAIYQRMTGINEQLTQLGVKAPKLPELPTGEFKEAGAELPDKLTDLGRMKEETVAKIANALDDKGKMAAVELAQKMGLDAETAGDALAGIHRQMKDMYHTADLTKAATAEAEAVAAANAKVAKARAAEQTTQFENAADEVDALRKANGGRLEWSFQNGELNVAEKGTETTGLLGQARKWVNQGVKAGAGRVFNGAGWKGAMFSRLAYGAAGYAVGGVEGAVLGASIGSARAETMGRIHDVVVHAAQVGAKALPKLQPLATYLGTRGAGKGQSLYDGEAARALIDEVHAKAIQAPDAMHGLAQGLMGQPGDIAFKLYAKTTQAIGYLSAMAPKDPGIDVTPQGSNWVPPADETHAWLNRYEAVMHPVEYAQRLLAGDGSMEGVEALDAIWPSVAMQLRTEAATQDWSKLTPDQASGLSMLYGQPVTGANDPDIQMMIQAQYVAAMQAPGRAQQGGRKGRGTGQPNGRPPKVQSPVAGSSVNMHTRGE